MFKPSFNWHFQKPQLYKHHFLVISNLLQGLSKLDQQARAEAVKRLLAEAIALYQKLEDRGIVFDRNSDGAHLKLWLTIVQIYATQKGW